MDALDALAFLGRSQAAALGRQIIAAYIQEHHDDPGFRQAVEALALADRSRRSNEGVARLDTARSQRAQGDPA
jgi:hypothetical protein